jgi:hypothetical protein
MSTTDILTSQWRVAIAQAMATLVVEVVKHITPTSDAYSPRARERLAAQRGSWERGVRTQWVLRVSVLGCDISDEILAGKFDTKKAGAAYDVAPEVEDFLWGARDLRNWAVSATPAELALRAIAETVTP